MQSSPRIDELRQKFHENPRRYFAPLANEYRKAGDPEQAIAICRAHLAQQPGHMSGHVVYGQALYDAGRIDEARSVFQQALTLDPENLIVLRHLGDIARRRGEVEEARSWYSRALDGDPQDAEVAAYLAELTEPLTVSGASEPAPSVPAETTPERTTAEAEAMELIPDESMFGDFTIAEESEAVPVASPYADVAVSAETSEELAAADESPYLDEAGAMDVSGEALPAIEVTLPETAGAIALDDEAGAAHMEDEGSPVSAQPEPVREARASRSTPTFESTPIVTRTLAELYLQQGYIEPALDIYRQLAEREPDDVGIRERISEISGIEVGAINPLQEPDVAEAPAEESELEPIAELESSVQLDSMPIDESVFDIGPMMTSEADVAAEAEVTKERTSSELWDTADSWSVGMFDEGEDTEEIFALSPMEDGADIPVTEAEPEPEPVADSREAVAETAVAETDEAPGPKTPAAEVPAEDETEAVEEYRGVTIREFFATLGTMRPPTADAGNGAEEATAAEIVAEPQEEESYQYADDAFAALFQNEPVSPEDSRAAAALSGAVAHAVPPASFATSIEPAPARAADAGQEEQPAKESEEDIRRFREWLEGLANS